jgi:hypothetical protein
VCIPLSLRPDQSTGPALKAGLKCVGVDVSGFHFPDWAVFWAKFGALARLMGRLSGPLYQLWQPIIRSPLFFLDII